ncbi:hypothetical protein [Spiroplasma diminutum]|uniref:Uncharacterized protein n=1 Tax=Spiroplasma diminutum CUAS-1 TaxID=1276221 RepID=S5LWD9_9MOLU|nr:hypothetical protein [Spiroplasma diminutum]AGR42104.1 hypothetical protein SDIMI_v3c04000 [Spiroplasma diminutum CUAS-1]
MATTTTVKNTKKTSTYNSKALSSTNKMTSGRVMEKPKILVNESISKVELLRQSNYLSNVKKQKSGEKDLTGLPEGVRKSIENKERIEQILNLSRSNEIEDIRKRFSIEKKPLNKKRANEIKEERIAFFKSNIEKSKSGRSKLSSLSYGNDSAVNKIRESNAEKASKKVKDSVAQTKTVARKKTKPSNKK